MRAAGEAFARGDYRAALRATPPSATIPRQLLAAVNRFGTDDRGLQTALRVIPNRTRKLFVNALQSLIFNRLATARVRRSPLHLGAVEGDIVRCDRGETGAARFAHVTEADVAEKRYTIHDVHVPLVGYATLCPGGPLAGVLEQILADDFPGITVDSFQRRNAGLGDGFGGAHRPLLARAANAQVTALVKRDGSDASASAASTDPRWATLGLAFDLEPSVYATVALRELGQ
jgi:tRNA(Glu) U13 pseudouridine synthase TruD